MSDKVIASRVTINAQALGTLHSLLVKLKSRPPGKKAGELNLAQLIDAKSDVIGQFGPAFSPRNVNRLSRETFLAFLDFKNNRHWSGLDRNADKLTKDFDRLREAIGLLVDENTPIRSRLERLRPGVGPAMVSWFGPAILTAILHVTYPERYGIFNNALKSGMEAAGLWPDEVDRASFAEQYLAVNPILVEVASQLKVDLWTLDYLWWFLAFPVPPDHTPQPTQTHSTSTNSDKLERTTCRATAHASEKIALPSGLTCSLGGAESRLLKYCRAEFAYYDAIPDHSPMTIEPIDIFATVGVNSFVNGSAQQIRTVHSELSRRCGLLLERFPVNADLMTFDPDLSRTRELIHCAVQAPHVLAAVATKVLHRKRRNLIPMLDSIVIRYYAMAMKRPELIEQSQYKSTAASAAAEILVVFREDLRHTFDRVLSLQGSLQRSGFEMTPVRILELLIWIEFERNGLYRTS